MSETNEKKARGGKCDDRLICKYGADCYRKNPAHFAEYRHPGILDIINPQFSTSPQINLSSVSQKEPTSSTMINEAGRNIPL